jgi:hypothetical protein
MKSKGPLLPQQHRVPVVSAGSEPSATDSRTVATRDHDVIKKWAEKRQAVPATGEASPSGAATSVSVKDGGAGIRFNFPGAALFRPISWQEWLGHFDEKGLTFVYEEALADGQPSARYRLVRMEDWDGQFGSPPK